MLALTAKTKARHKRKPSGAQSIRWENALSKDLTGVFLMNGVNTVTGEWTIENGAAGIYQPGYEGGQADLNGTNQYISVPTGSVINDTFGELAITARMTNYTSTAPNKPIAGIGDTQAMLRGNSGKLNFFTYDGTSWVSVMATNSVSSGSDVTATGTNFSGKNYLYMDGVLEGEATANPTQNSAYAFNIGRNSQVTSRFGDFKVVHVFVHNRGLSQEEAKELEDAPYQLLKPKRKLFIVPSVAVGAYTLTCAAGSYAVSGTSADISYATTIAADSGSYALSGTVVDINLGLSLATDSGAYNFTGTDAALTFASSGTYSLACDAGTYSFSGTNIGVSYATSLAADSGSYSMAGTAANLNLGRTLALSSGSYSLSGTAIAFTETFAISAETANYAFTGNSITMSYSGATGWAIQADLSSTWTGQADTSSTWTIQ